MGSSFWISGFSGRRRPLPPGPEDLDLEEIAHSLGNLCRFTGHCQKFYSVAEHSVRVSLMVPPEDAMWGLLHDASEAYLGDVSAPLKHHPNMRGYRALEAMAMSAVIERFNLPWEMPESVHEADKEAGRQEGFVLVTNWGGGIPKEPGPLVQCWAPEVAKAKFLERFREL